MADVIRSIIVTLAVVIVMFSIVVVFKLLSKSSHCIVCFAFSLDGGANLEA